jgi:phosphatidylglycerophosphatase A
MNTATFIASAGGAGYAPAAPGTFGSLAGIVIGVILLQLGHGPLFAGIIVCALAGLWSVWAVGGQADPGWIVIDEVSGQLIAMLALPRVTWPGLLLAFALFRLFDITKIGPIGSADRRHDALGVMADDWLAGLFAFVLLLALVHALPALVQ